MGNLLERELASSSTEAAGSPRRGRSRPGEPKSFSQGPAPSLELPEVLRQDGDILLRRGWREAGGRRVGVLVASSARDPPASAVLDRLAHEHGLKDELDSAWAARPLELVREGPQTLLVLEDPGGVPLDRLTGRPMEMGRFLRIAAGLAAAVGEAHKRGLVHKDIRPANILVDEAGGAVHLTGFGIASRLQQERATPGPVETLAGTLAYMAPEQTGRMNRSIDTRSDLYALGVTLYEMVSGELPFAASDPIEWVHCHIAQAPTPLFLRVRGVPGEISAIVMRCLAKRAEDRYQTAAGLAADLKRCLADWEAGCCVAPFTLGARDVPDVLRIPEKLYGREAEVDRLLQAFDRVASGGAPELVLVSGYSGVGKSSVVNELHRALTPARGLFAAGKFDQYKRDIPYSTLPQAFRDLIRPLLGKGNVELDRWRDELCTALQPNAALMVDLVPDLKLIIGPQPPVPDLPPHDAEHRFREVIRHFLRVFARPEHPLVLFFDDLQWLDTATLALLVDLATQSEVRSLLLVGAYRNNEVDATHPLMRSFDAIRKAGGTVSDIVLEPLTREDVREMIAEALHRPRQAALPLADLVFDKTGGNPFFTIQFVTALDDEKLLTFDSAAEGWVWDLQAIRTKQYTDNVVDLMVGKLARLPQATRDALQRFAALGDVANFAALALVLDRAVEEVHDALREAVQAGLVLRREDAYAFLHDRVQEAAYSLIPEASRAETHLHIGRTLSSGLPPEALADRIFDVVNQLNRGSSLVSSPEEREWIAELDLRAGKRARLATANAAALSYFVAGAELLAQDRWERRYDLAFPLELNRAECEFLTGDMAGAETRLGRLWDRAADTVDRAAVTCSRLALYLAMDRSDLAVGASLEYLGRIGIHWTSAPPDEDVRTEYETMWRRLGDRPIESLIDLPPITDPERRATLSVLMWTQSPALYTTPNLYALVVGRAVNLTLEYGLSDASPFAFAKVGTVLESHFGDYRSGFRFGKLGFDLVERAGLSRFKAEVYLTFAHCIVPWTRHIREGAGLMRRAFAAAREASNLNYTAYACGDEISDRLAAGDGLAEVQEDVERALELVRKSKFGLVVDWLTTQLQLVRMLRGLTPAFGSFNDAEFDEGRFEAHLAGDPRLVLARCWYWIRKLQARVISGDFTAAQAAAAQAKPLLWASPAFFEIAEYHFYAALACAGACEATPAAERLAELRAHADQLAIWAKDCPDNFADRAALVAAEIARIEGRDLEAMRLYEQAVRSAQDSGFAHNEALAGEFAGRFYLQRGFETNGLAHLRNAHAGYERWGAGGKARQLVRLHPKLAAREHPPAEATVGSVLQQLDMAVVIKASQAISAEIELPRLVDTLMALTLQIAGADRGLLLLPFGDSYRIEARARTDGAAVKVELRPAPLCERECPEALVNYVIHTQKSVILDDGSRPGPLWAGSSYLRRGPPRSVLCLPLLWQGKLGGALYLENSQATYAFTPDRVAVLDLLAARAAIALENARLYGELQEREAKIRRLVDADIIGIMIWSVDGRILEANDAFLAIIGYDREEMASGQIRWNDITPPEWEELDARRGAELLATGRCPPYEKEYVRKDGRRVPVLVGAATFSETSDAGVAFVLDLSERKQAETRQKVLIDELNHRVKNTLATVMAISSQTLRTTDSLEAFRKAFQGRLLALSKAHDLLTRTCWTGVSLRDLAEEQLCAHSGGEEGRFSLEGDDIRVGPVAAVTLGMALHELAVNAAKYGALSAPSGRVRVAWRPSAPGRLLLEWREEGGPPVQAPPQRHGFGSELIEKVLARELGGEVRLEFPREGAYCVMDMALDRVSAH